MRIARSFRALGTVNTITLYDTADTALLDRAQAEVQRLDDLWSVFKPDSEISRINAQAGRAPVPVSPCTLALLGRAASLSEASGGAFSITIGPLSRLWREAIRTGRLPQQRDIRRAAALVGDGDLLLDRTAGTAMLRRRGQELDLGSIAKGYAADQVHRMLQQAGVQQALLNFGGTVVSIGREVRVGIQHPRRPTGTPMGVLSLRDAALVTSGDYERSFTLGGRRYHHLIDPRTGMPCDRGLCSVTVQGTDAALLDALSTILFVGGPAQGLALLQCCSTEALLVTTDLSLYCTEGLLGTFRPYELYRKAGIAV